VIFRTGSCGSDSSGGLGKDFGLFEKSEKLEKFAKNYFSVY